MSHTPQSNRNDSKVVVITGASAGIGKATAEIFLSHSNTVCALQRRDAEGFDTYPTDVTDLSAVERSVSAIIAKYGRIDVLINNAGMGISGSIEDTPIEQIHKIFDVNFFGAVNVTKCVLPYMREAKRGTIINVSSVAAPIAIPFQAFYSTTKAAISSFTESLRIEVAPFGIKVTSVLPGDVKTDFTAKREKTVLSSSAYSARAEKAVAAMEKDEQGGMPPTAIASIVYRLSCMKNPPVYAVGGWDYKLLTLLSRVLPKRFVVWMVGKLY